MAYQVSKTSALQTAIKAGVDIAIAELQAGIINTHEEVVTRVDELKDGFLSELFPTVDADNANLASTNVVPISSGASGGGGGGGGSQVFSVEEAGGLVLNFGAFKGLTIAQVYMLTADDAKAYSQSQGKDYSRTGKDWLKWAAESKEPKGAFVAARAKVFLAANP